MNGKNPEPTEKMKEVGTGGPFKTLNQSAGSGRKIAKQSFYGLMQEELAKKTDYHRKVSVSYTHLTLPTIQSV